MTEAVCELLLKAKVFARTVVALLEESLFVSAEISRMR